MQPDLEPRWSTSATDPGSRASLLQPTFFYNYTQRSFKIAQSLLDLMALSAWLPTITTTTVLAAAVGALLLWSLISTAYQWYRLRKVPGPWLAGFSYLWIWRILDRGEHRPFAELGDQYGHLVRVGPNLLLTDLPDVLRRMSGTRSPYGKDEM